MNIEETADLERLQQRVANVVARNPAGHNLLLIGGFRYRFMDGSARMSRDLDYHWDGDLARKQEELVELFSRILLPEVRRNLGYHGSAARAAGPDSDSPAVRVVDLAFWKDGVPHSRIEVPVEITRIVMLDPPVYEARQGTIYPTASAKDMVEGKIIALLNRTHVEHRDFVDIFLFRDQLGKDSRERLRSKFRTLNITPADVLMRMSDFASQGDYHAKAIQAVVDEQLDPASADNITDAGGGRFVLDQVMSVLRHSVPDTEDREA